MNFDSDQASITPVSQTYLKIDSTGGLWLPGGTTGERPGSPPGPIFRYNTDSNEIEYWNGSAWTSPGGGSGGISSIAVAIGATSPTGASNEIAWSTTISEYVYWNGTSWQLLRSRAHPDITVVDWFSSRDAQFNGTTIDLTVSYYANPPVSYAPGQTILLLSESNEESKNGVYVLGSVASLTAVPLTRHSEWPSTRQVANGHRFYVKYLPRLYEQGGVSKIDAFFNFADFTSSDVSLALDYIQPTAGCEYPLNFSPGVKVRFTTTGTLPAPLTAGTDYYIYSAIRETALAIPRLVFSTGLPALSSPIDLTTTGSGTGTITIQARWGNAVDENFGNIGVITLFSTEWDNSTGGAVNPTGAITDKWVFYRQEIEPRVWDPSYPALLYFGNPTVLGHNAVAGGGDAVAIGTGARATSQSSGIAIGANAVATQTSIAIGKGATIGPTGDGQRAYSSLAVGEDALTFGGSSTAIGHGAKSEDGSIAAGASSYAKRQGMALGISAKGYNPQEVVLASSTGFMPDFSYSGAAESRAISFQVVTTGATETAAWVGGVDSTATYQPKSYAILPQNGHYNVRGELMAYELDGAEFSISHRLFGQLLLQSGDQICQIHGELLAAGPNASTKNLKFRFALNTSTNELTLYVTGIAAKNVHWRATLRLEGHNLTDLSSVYFQPGALAVGPTGSFLLPTSEALSAGQLVNIFSDGGVAKVRQAARDTNRPADGYIVNNYGTGDIAAVFTSGVNPFSSGLTVGALWLSTAGGVQDSSPIAGTTQTVGFAISGNAYVFQRGLPIEIT